MGHIKEPQDVDFIIQSNPLTDEERIAITKYIINYKAKQKANANGTATTLAKRKKVSKRIEQPNKQ